MRTTVKELIPLTEDSRRPSVEVPISCVNEVVAIVQLHARQWVILPFRHLMTNIDAEFLERSMRLIFERNRHSI